MTGKFPIGIQDFRKVIKDGYIYVDKTLMIKQILDDGASVYLYTRPRRFGKTINLSMLDYFFNIKYKEEVDLFDNLLISNYPEYFEHRSKYPIIRLDLSTITCDSIDRS
ncbi:MAG: AAA family ATPase, partial [Candidatus Methanomethylophilaceae archaeon]